MRDPIFTPDDFRGDWYGYLTNQTSHAALGVLLTWGMTLLCYSIMGEFPYKNELFTVMGILYLTYELQFQGWKGWDTVEDWMYFSLYGTGGTVVSFQELDVGSSLATFDISAPSVIFPVMVFHLLFGSLIRVYEEKRS